MFDSLQLFSFPILRMNQKIYSPPAKKRCHCRLYGLILGKGSKGARDGGNPLSESRSEYKPGGGGGGEESRRHFSFTT